MRRAPLRPEVVSASPRSESGAPRQWRGLRCAHRIPHEQKRAALGCALEVSSELPRSESGATRRALRWGCWTSDAERRRAWARRRTGWIPSAAGLLEAVVWLFVRYEDAAGYAAAAGAVGV